MLSFSLENNQLYTTWHQMQSETSITCKATGIYFEKIIEDRIRQKFIGFTESTETFSSMERLEETEFNMFKNDFQITYDMAIDLLYDRIPIKEGLDPIEINFHPRFMKVCMYDKILYYAIAFKKHAQKTSFRSQEPGVSTQNTYSRTFSEY